MAKTSIALSELAEKGVKDDIARELLGHVAGRLMEFVIAQRLRRVWRAQRRSQQQQQRISRASVGNARCCDRPPRPRAS